MNGEANAGDLISLQTETLGVWDDHDYVGDREGGSHSWSYYAPTFYPHAVTVTHVIVHEGSRVEAISVNINDLNSSKFFLKAFLSVFLHKEGEHYYAELVDFDVYGVGDDEKESTNDLKDNFVLYCESLFEEPGSLSSKLKNKLATLKKLVEINDGK